MTPLPPTLAAAVVLLDEEGRALLVRQNYRRRSVGHPGWRCGAWRESQEAAVREAREETGLDVELEHLVGVYCLRPERLGLRFVFKAHVSDGELLRFPTAEISEATWWPIDGLPANMTETAPHGIRDAADGKRGVTRDIWRE